MLHAEASCLRVSELILLSDGEAEGEDIDRTNALALHDFDDTSCLTLLDVVLKACCLQHVNWLLSVSEYARTNRSICSGNVTGGRPQ